MYTSTEENYLKVIYKITEEESKKASTSAIATTLHTPASSVTDMVKKLSKKKLINYEKHYGVSLTETGKKVAVQIVRKHRLWEVFLVEKLDFKWDKIHDIAEQLEHIDSEELIERLDKHLNYPQFDPHGDPIPDRKGVLPKNKFQILNKTPLNTVSIISGVVDHSDKFLNYLTKLGITIGDAVEIEEVVEYDNSIHLTINKKKKIYVSEEVGKNLLVQIKE